MKENNKIFRESSVVKLNSPEELNGYIRVITPSTWFVIAALIIAIVGILIWGIFGYIVVGEDGKGVATGTRAECYFESAEKISPGMDVEINNNKGVVSSVSQEPISRDSLKDEYSQYILYKLDLPQYVTRVNVKLKEPQSGVKDVTVILEHIRPISLIFK